MSEEKWGEGGAKRVAKRKKREREDLAGWILVIFAFVNLGLFVAGAIATRAGWLGD